MAEFGVVMAQAKRLCKAFVDCDDCPLLPLVDDNCHCPFNDRLDAGKVEAVIMKWAAEHPESRCPSWHGAWKQLFPDGQMWIDPKLAIPSNCDEKVLVIVDGRPSKNIEFRGAYQLAIYVEGEGWIVEGYEEWEGADVKWWMPLPELPEEE